MQIMQYNEARSLIKSGDVCAWSGKSLFGKLIKWWTKSNYSHVGIAWKANGRLFVIEAADMKGVRIFPVSRLRPFFWIKTDLKWTQKVANEAFRCIGHKYSLIGCVLAGLGLEPRSDDNWQCAEFVINILNMGELDLKKIIKTPVAITELFNNIIKVI